MSEQRASQNAARLSEDIGDVLSAIRRLIADDEALTSARDAVRGQTAISEDAGEFLARRYGGNAALARQIARVGEGETDGSGYQRAAALAEAVVQPDDVADEDDEIWPLGEAANAPGAARPRPVVPETPIPDTPPPPQRVMRHDADPARMEEERPEVPPARNDLVRVLSAGQPRLCADSSRHEARREGAIPPLRLESARRVGEIAGEDAGWRGWLRSQPKGPVETASETAESQNVAMIEEDDFAEAFDWKARMRPDLAVAEVDAKADEGVASGQEKPVRPSGWVSLPLSEQAPGEQAIPTGSEDQPRFHEVLAAVGRAEDAAVALMQTAPQVELAPAAAHDTVTGLSPEEEEQSIRDLLREMIQEELHGELGERFSRNLRAVIRREVAAAIDEQLDRF